MNDFAMIIVLLLLMTSSVVVAIRRLSSWTYLGVLMVTYVSLALYPQLISNYVIGVDAHFELVVAKSTLSTGEWNPNLERNIVNGALSISVFVPELALLAKVSVDFVDKLVFVIFPALSVPIAWALCRKGFGLSKNGSFFSTLLLIGTSQYLMISMYARQEVALFTGLLLMYLLTVKDVKKNGISVAAILLMWAIVVSHYSTAFLVITAFLVASVLTKYHSSAKVRAGLGLTGMVILLTWTTLLVRVTTTGAVLTIRGIFVDWANWATDRASDVVIEQLSPTLNDPLWLLNYVVNLLILGCLLLGVLVPISNIIKGKTDYSDKWRRYVLFSFLWILAVFGTMLPGVSVVYNAERVYITALLLCCGSFVIGIRHFIGAVSQLEILRWNAGRSWHLQSGKAATALAGFLVLSHLALQVGLPSEIIQGHADTKYFGNPEDDIHYTLEEEASAVQWIVESRKNNGLVYTPFYGRGQLPLLSYGMINPLDIVVVRDSASIHSSSPGSIFYQQKWELSKENVMYRSSLGEMTDIADYLIGQQTILDSGDTKVYYVNQ